MGARVALRWLVFGAALWPAANALPAAAQDDTQRERPSATRPQLPQPSGRIGRLRRDESGRIVPVGPPLPPEETPRGALFAPHREGGAGGPRYVAPQALPPITTFDPQILDTVRSRAEHELRARQLQRDVDLIVREEAEAKARGAPVNRNGFTAREEALLAELERMDREVQEHEMQHYFAGQPWARFPEYFYVTGPNGRRYAASGITPFDASAVGADTEATIQKLESLRRAALSPREPSEEDRRVAAALEQLIALLRRPSGALP